MADINRQTKQVINKNEITNPTKIFNKEKKEVVKEPLSLEEEAKKAIVPEELRALSAGIKKVGKDQGKFSKKKKSKHPMAKQ